MKRLVAVLAITFLAACAEEEPPARDELPFEPDYLGAAAEALDSDLIRVRVEMKGARDDIDVRAYANCAISGYAQQRGFGFTRHLRTEVTEASGIWTADAFYTMSPTIPQGVNTLEADVVVAKCEETGIPLV